MNAVFVGLGGVPYKKRACDVRLHSFAKMLLLTGWNVSILNRFPTDPSIRSNAEFVNDVKIIELFNDGYKANKLIKVLLSFASMPLEIYTLIKLNRKQKINILHLYSGHYLDFVFYFLVSRIVRAKLVYQYVEIRSVHDEKKSVYGKVNGWLCDKYGYLLFDGVISISKYIEEMLLKRNLKMKIFKVPPVSEFSFFSDIEPLSTEKPYILYCGNVGYSEVIDMIIDAYKNSSLPEKNIELVLVLSLGNANKWRGIKNVVIKENLSYASLIALFKGSKALLVPLRNTVRDIARFPNKICEYTACGGIVITTNVGEISSFFTDGVNALIADSYSEKAFTAQFERLVDSDEQSILKMKENSLMLGKQVFEFSVYKDKLDEFLRKI